MAERLATRSRDDEMLTTVMHPNPTHEGAHDSVDLTLEEEAALASMESHYDDPVALSTLTQPATEHDMGHRTTTLTPEEELALMEIESHYNDPITPPDPADPPATPPSDPPTGGSGGEGEPGDPAPVETKLDLVLVDQTRDAKDFARDAAEARLTNELNEGGRFKRFVKGIWKGNIAKEYYRQKYIKEAEESIVANQDVLVHETGIVSARGRAKAATIERFQHDYDEMISTRAGERRKVHEQDSPLALGMKGIMRDYAEGRIGDDTLPEEMSRYLTAYAETHGTDDIGEGKVRIDNYVKVAQATKGAIENGESIDNVLSNMRIITGEARTGARTEAHRTKADKAIEWMTKRRFTSVIPEAALITGTAIASGILRVGSVKTVGALAQTVAPGLAGGILAGIREWKHTKDERTQHSREMAMGKKFNAGDKRRERTEKTRYEAIPSEELRELLLARHDLIFMDDADRPAGQTKDDALKQALAALTAVEARNNYGDELDEDFISYSAPEKVGAEKLQLAFARARLKTALNHELDAATRARLSLDVTASVNRLVETGAQEFLDEIDEDMTAKDKAHRLLMLRNVSIAAGKGLGIGLAGGLLLQEGVAAADPTRAGLVEQLWNAENTPIDGVQHQTLLHGLVHGDQSAEHHPPSSEYTKLNVGERGTIEMSNDHGIQQNADGTIDIFSPDGKPVVEHLPVKPDGSLSPESIKTLESHGMIVENTTVSVPVETHVAKDVTLDQFMENHKGDTTRVTRIGWWDADTPGPKFDKNELGLQWGGKEGTGITKTGYQLNLDGMTESGSYHDGDSVNFKELNKEGNLKFAVSPTRDTQTAPFLLDIKPNGDIDIPKDHPAAQFFDKVDGKAVFTGKYGEVVEMVGKNEKGVEQIRPLATIVGNGDAANGKLHDIVPVRTNEVHPGFKITSAGYDTPGTYTEMAPVVPIVSRRSLERLTKEVDLTNPNLSPFYYGGRSLEELRDWVNAAPGRLQTRREVTNADGTKSWLEADGSVVERNVARERAILTNYLDNEQATNPNHYRMIETVAGSLGVMDDKNRVSVNVPAWMEEDNLDRFLTEYTNQVDKDGNLLDPSLYEINIIVNRKTGTVPDESVKVIKDFIAHFELANGFKPRVNYADVELDPPFNNVGYARKLLTDAVALRSVQRTGQTESLYMESEDADMLRVDKKVVVNLVKKMDENPHLDAVRGVQDRSPEYMKENDMLFLRRRANDFFEILARDKKYRDPTSPDWNFTWNRVVTGGWNTGFSAEVYALIGGYDSVVAGEDMSMGEKMTMIRGDGTMPNLEVVGTVASRSDSSPRRFIHEVAADQDAYVDFGNEADNKLIRDKSIPELLNSIKQYRRIDSTNEDAFSKYIGGVMHWANSVTPTRTDAEQFSHRLLFFLGFKKADYDIVGDRVRIHSWDNVKQSLEDYRARTA